MMDLKADGDAITRKIKEAPFFPFRTGNLKFHATKGSMIAPNVYKITFDSKIAPYVQYLEDGTGPHNIPGAFGKPLPFGIGGRFSGMFHPGSKKHRWFIKQKCVGLAIQWFVDAYDGEVR